MDALRLKTHTLGCKVNQYETELVREALTNFGYRDAAGSEEADLCVINTCTVTQEGDAKSRQAIRKLARDNPHAKLVVMGCYATRAPDELRQLPNVVEVVTDKRELPDLLGRFGVIDFPRGISHFRDHRRAFIKVQDGCLLRCSYCIIPQVRPQVFSRPIRDIVEETQRLVANGFREIVLTGIHLGHYGVEKNGNLPREKWTRLADLLVALMDVQGTFRIRLSSLEATEVTRDLISVLAAFPDRICPHLHLCLQSGSDRILRRMRRRWCAQRFLDRCELVRNALKLPGLTTDIIVGFPGETEEDFQATCRVAEQAGFFKIHAFPFSPRRGTPAASFHDQVSRAEMNLRMTRLMELEEQLRVQFFRQLQGLRETVLVESRDLDPTDVTRNRHHVPFTGIAARYVPVRWSRQPGDQSQIKRGDLVTIALSGHDGHSLLAATTPIQDPTHPHCLEDD